MIASTRQLKAALATIRPILVVSFLVRANVATVCAAQALGIPCIISERSQLSTHLENEHKGLRREPQRWRRVSPIRLRTRVIAVSNGSDDLVSSSG